LGELEQILGALPNYARRQLARSIGMSDTRPGAADSATLPPIRQTRSKFGALPSGAPPKIHFTLFSAGRCGEWAGLWITARAVDNREHVTTLGWMVGSIRGSMSPTG